MRPAIRTRRSARWPPTPRGRSWPGIFARPRGMNWTIRWTPCAGWCRPIGCWNATRPGIQRIAHKFRRGPRRNRRLAPVVPQPHIAMELKRLDSITLPGAVKWQCAVSCGDHFYAAGFQDRQLLSWFKATGAASVQEDSIGPFRKRARSIFCWHAILREGRGRCFACLWTAARCR